MPLLADIKVDNPLVLAPLAGYTDSPFRRIARRNGAGIVFTELISSEGVARRIGKSLDLLKFTEEERPIGIQLFGKNPEVMGEAARIAEQAGPDMIDINFGCSVRRVVRSGSGAALLEDPVKLGAVAEAVVKSVKIPVSAKIRTGSDERNKNYLEILHVLQDSGISLLTVHGRTRAQAFKGSADWSVIGEIAENAIIPVIGNGDISTHKEARSRLESSRCSAVMIGRGAVGNPWIFSGHEPGWNEIVNQINEHLEMMVEAYGEKGIILMRKHIVKYIRKRKNSAKLRALLVRAETAEEINRILDEEQKTERAAAP